MSASRSRKVRKARAVADAEFENQPFGRRSECVVEERPTVGEDECLGHMRFDIFGGLRAGAELQLGDERAAVVFQEKAPVEPLRERHWARCAAATEQPHFVQRPMRDVSIGEARPGRQAGAVARRLTNAIGGC